MARLERLEHLERVDLGRAHAAVFAGDPKRVAVLLPGAHYTTDMPLFWFSRALLMARGFTVLAVLGEYDESKGRASAEEWGPTLAKAALEHPLVARAEQVLVVAKSLASFASSLISRRALPAVWLTPLLNDERVVLGLLEAHAPSLIVGGSGDAVWSREVAARLKARGHDVVEVPGADHSLQFAENPFASVAALNRYLESLDVFVAELAALQDLARPRVAEPSEA